MYPLVRLAWHSLRHRNDPPLDATGEHVTDIICWPWDIDPWMELNNGRVLTLYDLGRVVLIQRMGMVRAMRQNRWGAAVAGATVRYRVRVRAFDRLTLRARVTGWDERFFYIEQSMWNRKSACSNHAVLRIAVTGEAGIVPTDEVARAMGFDVQSPELPGWIAAWSAADAERPWPPMQD